MTVTLSAVRRYSITRSANALNDMAASCRGLVIVAGRARLQRSSHRKLKKWCTDRVETTWCIRDYRCAIAHEAQCHTSSEDDAADKLSFFAFTEALLLR